MARGTFSTSNYFSLASAILTAAPMTLACRYFLDSAPSANHALLTISVFGSTSNFFSLGFSSSSALQAIANDGASSSGTISGIATGVWQHGAAVFETTTSRFAALNGTSGTKNTTSRTPGGVNRTYIGQSRNEGSPATTAKIAEAGFWSAALNDAELIALAGGISPTHIRPQSLVAYARLIRGVESFKNAWTTNGTVAVVDHPRVYS